MAMHELVGGLDKRRAERTGQPGQRRASADLGRRSRPCRPGGPGARRGGRTEAKRWRAEGEDS